ncbi:MAG: FAD-dependent oxidoreductase [Ectothiorhodospiraceae bacterium]|nr:FAD-dependent oxidoreductase [Ectothiorhodospiraceae bacterium]
MTTPVVIIGTGLAGYTTARELRKHDRETPLVLITSDDGRSYSKPQLSTGYRKGKTADALAMADAAAMETALDARILTGSTVETIDVERRTLGVSGESLTYGRLVLALGAAPVPLPLDGDGADRAYRVNDLQQYADFRRAADPAQRVLIVGGGLVGCEFANDLADAGKAVVQVFPEAQPLARLAPERAGAALKQALGEIGVEVRTGLTVERVDTDGDGYRARLSDGTRVQADVVLVAAGLAPRTRLATAAGLEVDRGIVVDRYLRTSAEGVYALGDCAQVEGHVFQYVPPLTAAARALGPTLAGEETAVVYPAMPVMVKTSCCQVVCWPPAPGTSGEWHYDGEASALRGEFRDADGRLRGFVLTGKRMRERMELTERLPPVIAG